jgi:hypothetical protein
MVTWSTPPIKRSYFIPVVNLKSHIAIEIYKEYKVRNNILRDTPLGYYLMNLIPEIQTSQ